MYSCQVICDVHYTSLFNWHCSDIQIWNNFVFFISRYFLFERFHVKIWHHYLFKAMITCKSSSFLMFKAMAVHIVYVCVCSFVCSYSDLWSLSLVASLFPVSFVRFLAFESVGNVHHSFKHSSQGFQFSCFFSMQWCQY